MKTDVLLNPEQKAAIQHGDGPLLIIAGAGSGKTTVVTERIKYLILKKQIPAHKILALTFTEKASREMEERIDVALPYGYSQLWVATFHSFCDRILRNEAIHIGLDPSYKLMSEAEATLFARKNIFKFKLNYFRPLGNPTKFISGMLQHFSRLKDEDVSPNEYFTWAQNQKSKIKNQSDEEEKELEKNIELANAYQTYEELKVKEGFMDFGNLIANTLKLFRERPHILKQYQEQFQYILVDEYQDTNFAQNKLAQLLAGERENITVVGDDDQAIYRWRGAAISNMIQFRQHYPTSKIVTLVKNYRSNEEILNSSYLLIQNNNPDRLEIKENINKKLVPMRKTKSYAPDLILEDRVENESDTVVRTILEMLKKEKKEFKDFAILVRANDHATPFARALTRHNIPFQFLGPGQLFHQEEIKDLIAYLKVLYNYEDSTSLYRVLNIDIFKIESFDIATLLNFARRKNLTLFVALEHAINPTPGYEIFFKDATVEKFKMIYDMIKRHLDRVSKDTAGQVLYYFLQDSGILQKMISITSLSTEKVSQNITKFFDRLKSFETGSSDASIFAVVDWIDLSMQMGESPLAADTDWIDANAVNILTIHSSKGLEFPVVFLVNLVTQRFPTRERQEQIPIPKELIKEILPEGDFHMQEERRLFYVGMTRAKDKLFLTAANYYGEGKRERKISPFVFETFGNDFVDKKLADFKERTAVIQPSLLEWMEKAEDKKPQNSVPTKITYISYTQLQSFDMCPLHYKLRYLLKIPGIPTAPLSYGTSIHSVLRDFYVNWFRTRKLVIDDYEPLLEKHWIHDGYTSSDHEREAREKAKNQLKTYIEKSFEKEHKNGYGPIAFEIPFNFLIKTQINGNYMGLKIGGRIDRVDRLDDGRIEIIDYKTGNLKHDDKSLLKDLQLSVYALAASEVNDNIFYKRPEEVLLSLHSLEDGKIFSTTRTLEQLEETKSRIFEKVKEIEESHFECGGTVLCKECEYKMLCKTH